MTSQFIKDCNNFLATGVWQDLNFLASVRDKHALEDLHLTSATSDRCESWSVAMRNLPLYHISSDSALAVTGQMLSAWEKGPSSPMWQKALTWLPFYMPAWNTRRKWSLHDIPDGEITFVLAYMLRPPIGWSKAGESDQFADLLESLVAEIRCYASEALPTTQKLIDHAVLAYLDIQMTQFGAKNLCKLARHRADLLQEILVRSHPGLSIDWNNPKNSPNRKRSLGIVMRYFKPFIDNWVLAGYLTALPREQYHIVAYSTQDIEGRIDPDEPTQKYFYDQFLKLIDKYIPLDHLPLEEIVQTIRSASHDAVIFGNAMHVGNAKAHLLQAYRLAPLTMITTNTSASCGFPSIDYYITASITEPADAKAHYTERLAFLPDYHFAMALDPAWEAAQNYRREGNNWRERHGIPLRSPLLISGAGWPKLTPESLEVWMQIMQAVPEAHLVLYPNSPSWKGGWFAMAQQAYISKLAFDHRINAGRITILSPATMNEILEIADHATLYLDSFPYSGNMALREPLLMGCPVVTRTTPHQRGLQGGALLRSLGMAGMVADSDDSYRAIAINFLTDKVAQADMRLHIKKVMPNAAIYNSRKISHDFTLLLDALFFNQSSDAAQTSSMS